MTDVEETVLLHKQRYATRDLQKYKDLTLRGLYAYERALMEKWLAPRRKTLEVGTGTGRVSFGLERQFGFQDVTGVDIVEEFIDEARRVGAANRSAVSFEVGSVTCLPFRAAHFEQVVCTENLISHLPTLETRVLAFRELARVLKPGGILLTDAMNAQGMKWYTLVVRQLMQVVRLATNPHNYARNALPRLRIVKRWPDPLFFLPNRPTVYYYEPAELVFDLLSSGFVVSFLSTSRMRGELGCGQFDPHGQELYVVCYRGGTAAAE